MRIWCFGDSWTEGCELKRHFSNERVYGNDDVMPELAWPGIIQRLTNIETINLGITGSSQPRLIEQLHTCDVSAGDIALFGLTTRNRRVYRTPENTLDENQYVFDERFSNPYEDERVASQTCALLYYMCKERGVTPYFFNLFDSVRYVDLTYNEIPKESWIIPMDHSVVDTLFDAEFFSQWDHHIDYNFKLWIDTENSNVQEYIRPCDAHPNLNGHRRIAEYIINKLDLTNSQKPV